jgi:class III poly(R)-hydroxyalkanoic acid synthase PhaE subunit
MDTQLQDWFKGWQKMAEQSLQSMNGTGAETVKATAHHFFSGQEEWLRLVTLANEVWASWLSAGASPEQWQATLTTFMEQLQAQMQANLTAWQQTQKVGEQWQLYNWSWQQLSQPWLTFWGQTPSFWGQYGAEGAAQSLHELNRGLGEAFMQTWGRMLGAPNLGLLREMSNQQNRVFALWQSFQQAFVDYQLLVGGVWVDAVQEWLERLAAELSTVERPATQRQWLDLWVEVADGRFLALFQSDAYVQAQGKLVNASMDLRREQRTLTESWLRINDLPTQSDLDEAHHQLYELRKEVKALKKSLQPSPAVKVESAPEKMRSTPATHTESAPEPPPSKRRTRRTKAATNQ